MQLLIESWNVLLELAPWLLFGTILSSLLHKFVPKSVIQRQLSGRLGVVKSVLFGIPLPLCSCSVIPTGLGLRKQGSSDGATVGFLIATPQTGIDSIIVSASFLGWPFAFFKVGAALITGVVGGLLVKENPATPITSCGGSEQPPSAPTWLDTWDHGIDLIRSIWKWLVFGVLLSAAISMFIPADGLGGFINNYAGGPVGASLLALLISVPLYVCATASVPIAAALVHGGLPLGAALVFLMAGPATNVATIGAVRSELGTRTTIVYLGTVIIGSLLLGLGFDFVLQSTPMSHGGHEHYTWWAQLSAILLIGMWLYFLWEDISMSNTTNQTSDNTKVFNVEGMTCGGCVNRLKKVLERTDGVEAATVTLEPGEAHVTSTLSDAAIIQIIEGAGFDVPQAS
jgi:uncharacterized membrane protein YraQ (UPF0718 family)/copper chaperone CopZ